MIRGDGFDQALFTRAAELVRARRLATCADLASLVDAPPPGIDSELLSRLRYIHEAGTCTKMIRYASPCWKSVGATKKPM